MSRWKQLTKSKREFLEELIELDDEHNFLTAVEYSFFTDAIRERRYKSEDSEWINRVIQKRVSAYRKFKKKT